MSGGDRLRVFNAYVNVESFNEEEDTGSGLTEFVEVRGINKH